MKESAQCRGLIALVTGGHRGIGFAIATSLAEEGATIACLGRDAAHGESAVAHLRAAAGGEASFYPTDLSDEGAVAHSMEAVLTRYGHVDIVVNNAAPVDMIHTGREVPFASQDSDTFDYMLKVGLYGPFWIAQRVLPGMVERGTGTFINVSSVASQLAIPNLPTYGVAKAALEAFARAIAADYGCYGIRANTILVGAVETQAKSALYRHPDTWRSMRATRLLDRIGVPEDVGRMAAFLASPDNDFLTAGIYPVDGGQVVAQNVPTGSMHSLDSPGTT